jgi:transposase-like protein
VCRCPARYLAAFEAPSLNKWLAPVPRRRSWVEANLVCAWKSKDVEKARTALKRLVSSLEEDHPGAAASLQEGRAQTLTLLELGLGEGLRRTLRSTNPIENLNATMERSCGRGCR